MANRIACKLIALRQERETMQSYTQLKFTQADRHGSWDGVIELAILDAQIRLLEELLPGSDDGQPSIPDWIEDPNIVSVPADPK